MQQDRLSPFHTELLEFLQRDILKRSTEEDLQTNPQMQKLLQGLNPSSADESLPLDEIIENYQHLFGAKGAVHVEKVLMEAFPPKDFMELGLSRYYPRMYRGLPRLYQKNYPSQSHIKKNFTHLPSLKKQAVSRALFSLYGKIPVSGKVTIFTWVINDGLGDYIAAVEIMRILRARLPDVELKFVALVQEKALRSVNYPENAIIVSYEGECPLSAISAEAMEVLRSSDLILQTPTYYPHTRELVEALQAMEAPSLMPKMERVGEYGFLESSWFHPKSGAYSMGLHFLEKGVLIRKPCQASWADVQNARMKQWHIPENHFYLAYLATPMGGAIYLHALLKSLMNDDRGIDLCVPDLGWFIEFVEKQKTASRSLLEWEMGIQTIEIYFEEYIHPISIAPVGKKVRILCPGQITQSDFRALLALSGDWVAVRGNQSFSEAVSQGKAFFYDGRGHERYFIKDLVAVAENRIGGFPGALECIRGIGQAFHYNVPVQEEEWVDETFFQPLEEWTSIALGLGLALQDPDTITGYKKLNQIIAEEFSANLFLCHLVQRALCHRKNPERGEFEDQQLALFASNAITFAELISNCRKSNSVG